MKKLKELHQRIRVLNRVPPWAIVLIVALGLVGAGIGQGVITGSAPTEIRQAVVAEDVTSSSVKFSASKAASTTTSALIASQDGTRFVVEIGVIAGDTRATTTNLNNRSASPTKMRYDIGGLPAGVRVSVSGTNSMESAKLSPNSFLLKLNTGSTTLTTNFETEDNVTAGFYSVTLTLTSVQD